jgi:cytochrome c553
MRRLQPHLAVVLLVAGTYSVPAQNLSDRIAACLSCHGDDGQSYIVGTPSLGAEPARSNTSSDAHVVCWIRHSA